MYVCMYAADDLCVKTDLLLLNSFFICFSSSFFCRGGARDSTCSCSIAQGLAATFEAFFISYSQLLPLSNLLGLKDRVSLLHAIFRRIGGNTKVLKKTLLGNLCAVFRSEGSLFVELN